MMPTKSHEHTLRTQRRAFSTFWVFGCLAVAVVLVAGCASFNGIGGDGSGLKASTPSPQTCPTPNQTDAVLNSDYVETDYVSLQSANGGSQQCGPTSTKLDNTALDSSIQNMVKPYEGLSVTDKAIVTARWRVAKEWLSHLHTFDTNDNYGFTVNVNPTQQLGHIVTDKQNHVYGSPAANAAGTVHAIDYYVSVFDGGSVTIVNADRSTMLVGLWLIPKNPSDLTKGYYAIASSFAHIEGADGVEVGSHGDNLYTGVDIGDSAEQRASALSYHAGEFMVIGFQKSFGFDGVHDGPNQALFNWLTDREGDPPPFVGEVTDNGDVVFPNGVSATNIVSPISVSLQIQN